MRRYYDSEIPGFGVVVYLSGAKSFFVEYGPRNKRSRAKVGRYGPMTVAEARSAALRMLGKASEGVDPLDARVESRKAETFGQWVETYLSSIEGHKNPGSIKEDRRHLGRAIEHWRNRRLADITTEDVQRFFEAQKAHGTINANRALASVSACLSAAWRLDKVPSNVALKVEPFPENPPRARVLSDEEYKRLIAALKKVTDPHVRAAFHLLLDTC